MSTVYDMRPVPKGISNYYLTSSFGIHRLKHIIHSMWSRLSLGKVCKLHGLLNNCIISFSHSTLLSPESNASETGNSFVHIPCQQPPNCFKSSSSPTQ